MFYSPDEYFSLSVFSIHVHACNEFISLDFLLRFKKNDELAVYNISEKLVIPTPVEMNMKSSSVKVDSSWTVVNSTKYYKVAKLIAGNID